jgi:hypothetical protein
MLTSKMEEEEALGQSKLQKQLHKLGDAQAQITQLNNDLSSLVEGYGKDEKKKVEILGLQRKSNPNEDWSNR